MSSFSELPSEWPMWYHDARNTGRSDLKGSILNPAVKWRYYVGGQAQVIPLKDFPRKGDKGMVLLYGGKVFARDAKGGLIWESPLIGANELIEVSDLDGDGVGEVILAAQSRILILSALNGQVLWNYALPRRSGISGFSTKVVALGSYGPCLVTWAVGFGSPGRGYAFSFEDGIKDAKLLWCARAPETEAFTPELILSDIDSDGKNEVVTATYNKVYVFSGEDGSVKAICHNLETNPSYKNGRNYGCLVAADYDGDGYPEIFLLAHQLNQHIGVIENSKEGLSQVYTWDKFFQYSYPEDTKEVRIVPNSVQDIDNDGRMEIVVSLFNENGDGRWHLVAIDPANGKYKYDLLDLFLHGIMDINGDGRSEIVASKQVRREPVPFSTITAYEITDGGPRQVLGVEKAKVILQPRMEYDLSVSDMGNSPGVFSGDIDNDGLEELFVYFDNDGDLTPDRIAAYGGKTLVKKWERSLPQNQEITLLQVDDLDGDGEIELLTSGKDGYVRIWNFYFLEKVAIKTGGFLCCPTAARLCKEEGMRTFVPTSSKEIVALETRPNSELRIMWSRPGYGKLRLGGSSPVVVDLDGDGEKEIIIAEDSNGTYPRLVILNADGTEKRSFPLKEPAYDWNVGHFQKKDELDIYVATQLPRSHVRDTFIFSGKGDAIPFWTKPIGPFGMGLAAIYDVDGDGLDDILMLDGFVFHILDGLMGEDLIPLKMLRCADYGTGHHTPTIDDVDNDGVMEILLAAGWGTLRLVEIKRNEKGNLSPTDRWVQEFTTRFRLSDRITRSVTHEISGRMAGLADVDGDGMLEVGVGTASGTVICYDAATGRVKWTYDLEAVPSHIVTADIDGCGHHEFIFGARDGKLYALKGGEDLKDRILWTYDFGYEVGTTTIADIDGDGEAEILVSVSDGYVYAIDDAP